MTSTFLCLTFLNVEAQSINYTDKEAYFDIATTRESNLYSQNPLETDEDDKDNRSTIQMDHNVSLMNSSLFSFWNDPNNSCNTNFRCVVNSSTGWHDQNSIQISTMNNDTNNWSSIYGKEASVTPNERYDLVTHLRHNNWTTQSHIGLQGFNESSKAWYEIEKCPSATNKSLNWNEYKCIITIEPNVTKVRAILNAGQSLQYRKEAISWFDSIYLTKFKPILTDPSLKAEVIYEGLVNPVSMQFLGPDDFLVIENRGTVQRITDGKESTEPLLSLNVEYNQGLLGIAIQKNASDNNLKHLGNNHTYVYLYYTAKEKESDLKQGKDGVSNRLYRYELINDKLVNPKKLLELPAEYDHNGGPLLIGPENNTVYLSVGDLENESYEMIPHKALNNITGLSPDGSGGILRVTLDGNLVGEGILGNTYPINLYYAYGIRECFGMDFDPVTGILWNSENGANWGDEINLVSPGFNGGWNKVQGIWKNVGYDIPRASDITYSPSDLVTFDGKGKYRTPEFTWNHTVGPTALKFLNTEKLGNQYENDILVANVNNGDIYHFELNNNRDSLLLNGTLSDKLANTDNELENIIFAKGFGVITDLKVGYDGYLYIVVFTEGKIYRVSPLSYDGEYDLDR